MAKGPILTTVATETIRQGGHLSTNTRHASNIEWLRSNGERQGPECPSSEEMARIIELIVSGRGSIGHIVECSDCLDIFTELLRLATGPSGPAFWKQQGLSTRTSNALAKAGVLTWVDLWSRKTEAIPGIGLAGAAEIAQRMNRLEDDPE